MSIAQEINLGPRPCDTSGHEQHPVPKPSDEQHEALAASCQTEPGDWLYPNLCEESSTHVEASHHPWQSPPRERPGLSQDLAPQSINSDNRADHVGQDSASQTYTLPIINASADLTRLLSPDYSHHREPWDHVQAHHLNEVGLAFGSFDLLPELTTLPHAPVQAVFPSPVPTPIRSNISHDQSPLPADPSVQQGPSSRDDALHVFEVPEQAVHFQGTCWSQLGETGAEETQDWSHDLNGMNETLDLLQDEAVGDDWVSLSRHGYLNHQFTPDFSDGSANVVTASARSDLDFIIPPHSEYYESPQAPPIFWNDESNLGTVPDLAYFGDWPTPSSDSMSPISNLSSRRWSNGVQARIIPSGTGIERHKQYRRLTTSAFEPTPGSGRLQLAADAARRRFESSLVGIRPTGKRAGPLTPAQRRYAADHRKKKSVCIRCRWCKCVREEPDGPCTSCLAVVSGRLWEQPCTKADFLEVVKSGTLNYISQRAINHFTIDESRRIRLELPETFQLNDLISLLNTRKDSFNIRARQASGSLYVIDLHECAKYLTGINKRKNHSEKLCDFIDHDILKADNWLDCVKDCDPTTNILALLSVWNNMPSRASYDFVSRDPTNPAYLPMDVQTDAGRTDIMLAAQLSRIVCRKLEVAGYAALQKLLNGWHDQPAEQQGVALQHLGQLLLTLRWRVSWWMLLGDGGKKQLDAGKQRFEDRVTRLCRVLYFYYCNIRKKLPSFSDTGRLEGIWSSYADAGRVYDDFPKVESLSGFEEWMLQGKKLIVEAGVAGNLDKIKTYGAGREAAED